MASRELNILVAAKGALKAARDIGAVDKATSNLSRNAGRIGKAAAVGIGAGVTVGAVVIGRGVKSGIESLALLEDATTQVTGAIDQVGLAGRVSAAQVATWANQIEADVDAAFDDKDIVSATANLIRFGKVSDKNLQPAMVVMTDLAAKTGDVGSASALLGKALADPAKAAGKLSRFGVVLTETQQKQIKAAVKAGDAYKAQEILLAALADTTKGAAAASAGPYRDSLNILADVTEDAQRALGEGFLPVITKVSDILTRELAKPGAMNALRDLGKGLAGGLEQLVDVAIGLPWDSIKSAFIVMGTGGKALLSAFTSMPPWVQTAVLTGWGLNKLTGGAVGGIVGELSKGLIKGVLGMTAGVVHINAGTVTGVGGVPGAAPVGGAGLLGKAASFIPAGLVATAIIAAAVPIGEAFASALPAEWKGPGGKGESESQRRIREGKEETARRNPPAPFRGQISGIGRHEGGPRGARGTGESAVLERATAAGLKPTADQITRTYNATAARQAAAAQQQIAASQRAAFATEHGADRIVAAIRGMRITTPAPIVNVTARSVTNNVTRWQRVANRPHAPGRGPTAE